MSRATVYTGTDGLWEHRAPQMAVGTYRHDLGAHKTFVFFMLELVRIFNWVVAPALPGRPVTAQRARGRFRVTPRARELTLGLHLMHARSPPCRRPVSAQVSRHAPTTIASRPSDRTCLTCLLDHGGRLHGDAVLVRCTLTAAVRVPGHIGASRRGVRQ